MLVRIHGEKNNPKDKIDTMENGGGEKNGGQEKQVQATNLHLEKSGPC